jgi:hypothetical protein
MSLWADKYQPKALSDLTYHPSLTKCLKKLVNTKPRQSKQQTNLPVILG